VADKDSVPPNVQVRRPPSTLGHPFDVLDSLRFMTAPNTLGRFPTTPSTSSILASQTALQFETGKPSFKRATSKWCLNSAVTALQIIFIGQSNPEDG
jgi:hypothetical protein